MGEGLLGGDSGNVTDDMWTEYIKNQVRPSPTTTSTSRERAPCPPQADRSGFKP